MLLFDMIESNQQQQLIRKYDVPVPRYTSYPTMPYWNTAEFTTEKWIEAVQQSFLESNDTRGISVYIHLPFCESLCTYCACNTRITKNHKVETHYIKALLQEWKSYQSIFGKAPQIRELHLGGGTPTFFSPENLKWLITELLRETKLHDDFEFSFEGHPNNTTASHLQTLFDLGFRRVSFGVQDLDEKVQRTINRIQPFGNLKSVTESSRNIGYQSISYDLIYGLPFQTTSSIINTIDKVLSLKPERVSFYSYAHVPWLKPGQRGYEDADLPTDVVKRNLYETGRLLLKQEGYHDIGMDHFALPHDSLFTAQASGKLHRNFMGYTTNETDLLIGLGTSAISDAKYAYAQNLKKVEAYTSSVMEGQPAVFKGHVQTKADLHTKACILDVACRGRILHQQIQQHGVNHVLTALERFEDEGLLLRDGDGFTVSENGRPFIRNICRLFDLRMDAATPQKEEMVFSRSI